MKGSKRFPSAILPNKHVETLEVWDMKGVISLVCEDPGKGSSSTKDVPFHVGQCWFFSRRDNQQGPTSLYKVLQPNKVSLLQWVASPDLAVGDKVCASSYMVSEYGTTSKLWRASKRGST